MSNMLSVFSLLSRIDVSYKTVERLYSDKEINLVLHNLHMLILKRKEVKDADCTDDGTGYALSVKNHYATEAQKLKDKVKNSKTSEKKKKTQEKKKQVFIYSFKLMDLDHRMYIGYGTSLVSEKDAFKKAVETIPDIVNVKSLRLDKYFSNQCDVEFAEKKFGKDLTIYLIPKKNATIRGPWKWKWMSHKFVNKLHTFL